MSLKKRDYDVTYKVLVLGESTVGKTALICSHCETEKEFNPNLVLTIGIDYKTEFVTIDKLRIRVQIWDTAGQERFRTMNSMYYRGAKGILLLNDITNKESFMKVTNWMEDLKEYNLDKEEIILIGNKLDLDHLREVSTEEGKRISLQYGIKFTETSAKTGENVHKTFENLVSNMKDAYDPFTVPSDVGNEDWEALHQAKGTIPDLKQTSSTNKAHQAQRSWCCSG